MATNETATKPDSAEPADDLLAALVLLTRIHDNPYSSGALTAGLPLVDGCLTPALFVRAAEQAGFNAKHLERTLADIPELVLPVVLVLDDGGACLLLRRSTDQAIVVFPGDDDIEVQMPLADLTQRYAGECLYLKPTYDFAPQNDAAGEQHWFWSVVARSKGIYTEVLVASLLINLFALVSPLFIMNVYDRVVPNHALDTLWVLASGVFIVYFFDIIMKSLRGYFVDVAGKRADIILSSRTYSRVLDIQMKSRPPRVGSFANNLQEFDSFREFFTSTTLITVIDLPFVLLFVLLIYGIGGTLAVVPLVAIPTVLLSGYLLQRPLRDVINRTFTESARKHAMLIESLTALDAIKGARAEGVMQRRWEEFNARIARLALRSRFLSLSAVNVAQVIQQLGTVAVVILGVYQIIAGELSVGGLIACTILTGRALAPMAQVASVFTRYHHSIAAFAAINRVMSLPVERPVGHKFLHRPHLAGRIEFRNVTFGYPGAQVPAVSQFNFEIAAGERVAIIGRMGSGKSTVHKLLMRFYDPTEGSILINGTDAQQIDPNDLRGHIGYVPQDVMLLSGTIRENIVLGHSRASDGDTLAAAGLSGILPFINEHPEGFDFDVGERGLNLSGGQRQAVAIARALLAAPSIVLLDEPTNAMDNTAENHFKHQLTNYLEGKTLILVTHKSSMLSLVDRLIVLNDGQLVADGPRDDILKALAGGGANQ